MGIIIKNKSGKELADGLAIKGAGGCLLETAGSRIKPVPGKSLEQIRKDAVRRLRQIGIFI